MDIFEVMVIGGGMAGLCAALQEARAGAKTLLVEKNGLCGGTATVAGINFPGLFDAWGRQIIAGIGWELITRTLQETGQALPEQFLNPDSNRQHWRHQVRINALLFAALADEGLLEAGVDCRYHTMLATLQHQREGWTAGLCGKDGLYEVQSKMVIDCSGDANATVIAGYETRQPETTQPGTLSVIVNNYDCEKLDLALIAANFAAAAARGEVEYCDIGWGKTFTGGFLRAHGSNSNHIAGSNAADSSGKTKLEIAGRRSIRRLYRFLKSQPGLENLELQMVAGECGVRESRTIVGEATVSAEDYLAGRKYADAICNAFYQIDLHDADEGLIHRTLAPGVVPTVPLRALIPKQSQDFLAAGRILSSDRLANSALRVQAVCMATGQAAGAAAALAAGSSCQPGAVPLPELHALLRRHQAIVP
ncbi:MAG: FAD-dependent oxidoreductase [Oligosphaeraceae bacterium]|nr:FAD-dependent oxidoreductase [Oligosphaeraceae bacterium]